MGIQKLGHIMVKRLQARPYSSQARVPIPPPPPASAITQIREGIAATSITWCLFAPVCWGLMYWFDVREMRTVCNALKDYEKEFERRSKDDNVPRQA